MLAVTEKGLWLIRQALGTSRYYRPSPPVTLAGPQRKPDKAKWPKLTEARRERITGSAVAILRSGTFSKFEFEGPVLAGIRHSLCLEGWPFPAAEDAARLIVDRALSILGAVRPTWHQGQPDYGHEVIMERTRCVHCLGKLPERRPAFNGGQLQRFCSVSCRKAERNGRTVAEWQAQRASIKEQFAVFKTRECQHCREDFVSSESDQRYCSPACSHSARRKHALRECEACGKEFQPYSRIDGRGQLTATTTCSIQCAGKLKRKPLAVSTCPVCSTVFTQKRPNRQSTFCSPPCSVAGRKRKQSRFQCQEITS